MTGRESRRAEPLLGFLRAAGIAAEMFSVAGEPDIETVTAAIKVARDGRCSMS